MNAGLSSKWKTGGPVKGRKARILMGVTLMAAAFDGRVALVTGGSRGIGRATALRLASEGADVAISYASRTEEAQQVVSEITSLGKRALCHPCDVADPEQVRQLVDRTREELGAIELMVHSGAIISIYDHSELSYDRWYEMINVNLTGTYNIVFAVKDEMIKSGFGRMVTVSSIAALRARQTQIHYSASKAGVIALTRCCAEAFAPHNVRINCVAPGLTETEMAHVLSEETIEGVVQQTPMKRIGQPEELASTIRFLLSEESSFMTGQTLVASGGRVMLP